MAVMTPITVTFYARVGDSEVLNEIGTIKADVVMTTITDENRRPGDAVEAVGRVEDFDLVGALRTIADELEAART